MNNVCEAKFSLCLSCRLTQLHSNYSESLDRYRGKEDEVSYVWCLKCVVFLVSAWIPSSLEQLEQFKKKHADCDVTKVSRV